MTCARQTARSAASDLSCMLALALCLLHSFCSQGGEPQDAGGKPDMLPESYRTREYLVRLALQHALRLGVLAEETYPEDFMSKHTARVLPTALLAPTGVWDVRFENKRKDAVLHVYMSTEGKLIGLKYLWPNLSGRKPDIRRKPQLSYSKALLRAKEIAEAVRGTLPEDAVLESADYVVPARQDLKSQDRFHASHWVFKWCQYDGNIRYEYSTLKVVFCSEWGVLECVDQLQTLRTRHVAKVSLADAAARAQQVIDERKRERAGPKMLLAWEHLLCEADPVAYVWKVPGDEADFLVYKFEWKVNWFTDSPVATPTEEVLEIYIDARTGEPVARPLIPMPNPPFLHLSEPAT